MVYPKTKINRKTQSIQYGNLNLVIFLAVLFCVCQNDHIHTVQYCKSNMIKAYMNTITHKSLFHKIIYPTYLLFIPTVSVSTVDIQSTHVEPRLGSYT